MTGVRRSATARVVEPILAGECAAQILAWTRANVAPIPNPCQLPPIASPCRFERFQSLGPSSQGTGAAARMLPRSLSAAIVERLLFSSIGQAEPARSATGPTAAPGLSALLPSRGAIGDAAADRPRSRRRASRIAGVAGPSTVMRILSEHCKAIMAYFAFSGKKNRRILEPRQPSRSGARRDASARCKGPERLRKPHSPQANGR